MLIMRKEWLIPAPAYTFVWTGTIPTFAGEWKQDDKSWWYQYENEAYPHMTGYPADMWVWIDGDGDNVAERYYF